ncbi:glycosyl hydrolase family 61-domain-containing protein, partial [Vararia minispora EC-137]
VSAHGFLGQCTIDGVMHKGTGDGGSPANTAIRPTKPYDVGPVKGASNTDLRCGLSPVQNAALQADAQPGSTVDVLWVGQNFGNWIHEVGPVMAYMAECTGVKDCTTFDPANAKWFKVDQKGLKSDGTTWYMADLYNGKPVSFNIPQNLKAGNYLLRSELIALHNAVTVGGAEFYPNCVQLKVGGSGTGVPSQTVSFPGAYSDSDPGIVVPNIYNPGFTYQFPGPALVTLTSGGSSSSSSSSHASNSSSSASSSSPKPSSIKPSAAKPSSTKTAASAPASASASA